MSQDCPFCAEPIAEGLEKCPKCGESLLKGSPCKLHPESEITRTCTECGEWVCEECKPPGSADCVHCSGSAGEDVDAAKHYELGEVIGLVFKDPDWVNHVLIGAACFLGSFLFVPMLAFFGYRLRIIRQQWRKPNRTTLPTWDGFGELISDGFRWFVTLMLPGLILMGIGMAVIGGSAALIGAAGRNNQGLQSVGIAGVLAGYALIICLALFLTYVQPAIEELYLRTGEMTAGLQVKRWWKNMSYDHVDYLIFFLYHYLITQILGAVGMVLCFVGMYASIPWAYYTEGAMFGRRLAKKDQQAKRGKPDYDAEFEAADAMT